MDGRAKLVSSQVSKGDFEVVLSTEVRRLGGMEVWGSEVGRSGSQEVYKLGGLEVRKFGSLWFISY